MFLRMVIVEAQDRTWVCGMKELPYYIIVEGRVKFQRPSQLVDMLPGKGFKKTIKVRTVWL